MVRTIDTPTGIFEPGELEAAIRPAGDRYAPRSRLVSVEQTTNLGGGRVWPLETVRAVLDVAPRARHARAPGRRAADERGRRAAGRSAADWAGGFDTAWIDFTKGLGAPVGAVLAGSRELIDEAWRYKQMIGGALRQSGIVAAACLYALDHHVDRLAEDHRERARPRRRPRRAARLRRAAARHEHRDRRCRRRSPARGRAVGARRRGHARCRPTRIRCVTHLDVDAAGIERALSAFREVAG